MDERTVKDIVDWVFNALTEFDAPVIEVQKVIPLLSLHVILTS